MVSFKIKIIVICYDVNWYVFSCVCVAGGVFIVSERLRGNGLRIKEEVEKVYFGIYGVSLGRWFSVFGYCLIV